MLCYAMLCYEGGATDPRVVHHSSLCGVRTRAHRTHSPLWLGSRSSFAPRSTRCDHEPSAFAHSTLRAGKLVSRWGDVAAAGFRSLVLRGVQHPKLMNHAGAHARPGRHIPLTQALDAVTFNHARSRSFAGTMLAVFGEVAVAVRGLAAGRA